jgi:hypothetical protein
MGIEKTGEAPVFSFYQDLYKDGMFEYDLGKRFPKPLSYAVKRKLWHQYAK